MPKLRREWFLGVLRLVGGSISAGAALVSILSYTTSSHAAAGGTRAHRLALAPSPDSAGAIGDTVQLAALATDERGAAVPGMQPVWTTTDPAVLTVDQAGTVVAAGSGSAVVVVRVGELEARRRVVVPPATLGAGGGRHGGAGPRGRTSRPGCPGAGPARASDRRPQAGVDQWRSCRRDGGQHRSDRRHELGRNPAHGHRSRRAAGRAQPRRAAGSFIHHRAGRRGTARTCRVTPGVAVGGAGGQPLRAPGRRVWRCGSSRLLEARPSRRWIPPMRRAWRRRSGR